LPPNGGFIIRILPSVNLFGGVLTTGLLEAVTQGGFDQARSQAQAEDLNLNVGGNLFTANLVPVSSQCTCPENGGPPTCDGGVMIDNLRINDVFIVITTIPNQTINLANGGSVVINEQFRTGQGNAASLTVNGVHVRIPAMADVIISSAQSGISCGTTQ